MKNRKLRKFIVEVMDNLTIDELFDELRNGLIRGDWTNEDLKDVDLKTIDIQELIKEAKIAYDDGIHNLFCAVLLETVKDYCGETSKTIRRSVSGRYFDKPTILKDLRSDWLVSVTNGLSLTVADQLEANGARIKANLQNMVIDFDIIKVHTYDKPEFR